MMNQYGYNYRKIKLSLSNKDLYSLESLNILIILQYYQVFEDKLMKQI